jgi:hypothetical protein
MAKTAKKIDYVVSFGTWISKSKARGDVAELVKTIRADKRVTEATALKGAEKKYGSDNGFPVLVQRYTAYNRRLSA